MLYLIDDNLHEQQEQYGCGFLNEKYYQNFILNLRGIKTHEYKDFFDEKIKFAEAVLFHSTSKNMDRVGNFIESRETIKELETFLNKHKIPYVSFSWGHTSYKPVYIGNSISSMNKRIFYLNLKEFLDDYIKNNKIDLKILGNGIGYKKEILIEQANRIILKLENYTGLANICVEEISDIKPLIDCYLIESQSKIGFQDFNEQYLCKSTVKELIELIKKSIISIRKYGKNIYY